MANTALTKGGELLANGVSTVANKAADFMDIGADKIV